MKLTQLLVGSLTANAVMLAALALKPNLAPPAVRDFFAPGAAAERRAAAVARLAQDARARAAAAEAKAKQSQLWATWRGDELTTLVASLRAAGFPAGVIREVVRSEVNARYRDRLMALSAPDKDTPYWRTPPAYYGQGEKRFQEIGQIDRERAKLLRDLLADDFFSTSDVTADQRRQFGNLSRQKIDAVQRIEDDYNEMFSQLRAATNGVTLPEDREKFALLAREKQSDLAAVLSPDELADYTMRSSPITNLLRNQLGTFEPTEAEFRAIFAMQQALNEKFPLNSTGGMISMGSDYQSRQAFQQELEANLKATFGDARYADYLRETNREYQQLSRLATADKLPADATQKVFGFRDTVAQQSNRIFDDGTLSADEKRTALQTLAQNTRAQMLATLGPVSGPAYVKLADNWLNNVERGSAVTFSGLGGFNAISSLNGSMAMVSIGSGNPVYRRLPSANPPPRP